MSDIELIKEERFRGLRMLASFVSPEKEVFVLKDDKAEQDKAYHVYVFMPVEGYGWSVSADVMHGSAERAFVALTGRLRP